MVIKNSPRHSLMESNIFEKSETRHRRRRPEGISRARLINRTRDRGGLSRAASSIPQMWLCMLTGATAALSLGGGLGAVGVSSSTFSRAEQCFNCQRLERRGECDGRKACNGAKSDTRMASMPTLSGIASNLVAFSSDPVMSMKNVAATSI